MKIAFVGLSGFPYLRSATMSRLQTTIKAIVHDGGKVFFLNRHGLAAPGIVPSPGQEAIIIGEASGTQQRLRSPFSRLLHRALLPLREWRMLTRWHRHEGIDSLHVYTQDFAPILLYWGFARIHGLQLCLHYVELRSQIDTHGKSIFKRINDHLLDGFALRLFDTAFPISGFLEAHIRLHSNKTKIIQIPPICDFDEFDAYPPVKRDSEFVLYCGSVAYLEVVDFILDSWNSISDRKSHQLILVLGGSAEKIAEVRSRTGNDVAILTNLEYGELVGLYKSAKALLIPLRPTLQDCARFPQKICEYVASRGLVVTTNVGEIPLHFKDGVTALIAPEYSISEFGQKLETALTSDVSHLIADAAWEMGRDRFDWRAYAKLLHEGTIK